MSRRSRILSNDDCIINRPNFAQIDIVRAYTTLTLVSVTAIGTATGANPATTTDAAITKMDMPSVPHPVKRGFSWCLSQQLY